MLRLQEEWERDRQGLPALTAPVFFDAVFEMVDQWSSTVNVGGVILVS
jgi:hypothetical protein